MRRILLRIGVAVLILAAAVLLAFRLSPWPPVAVVALDSRARHAGIPSTGNGDPLAPQAVTMARRLTELGVRVDALFFATDHPSVLPHEYQFNLDGPDGQRALTRMLAFLGDVRPSK